MRSPTARRSRDSSHVSSLLRKLDVSDRQALARVALQVTPAPVLVGAPSPFTSFVGRRHEAQRLRDSLARDRLVTLTGPGSPAEPTIGSAPLMPSPPSGPASSGHAP